MVLLVLKVEGFAMIMYNIKNITTRYIRTTEVEVLFYWR